MTLFSIIKIGGKVSRDHKKLLDDLRTKVAIEESFEQSIVDQICKLTAACHTVLGEAIAEISAEKSRLSKDVFADRLIHDVFDTIRGDEASFPERVYENHDAYSASYRAGQQCLDNFQQGLCKEWVDISKMSTFKRKDFILLARRKLMTIIAEIEKSRGKGSEESKKLEEEVKNLQGVLKIKEELEEATEESHDTKKVL